MGNNRYSDTFIGELIRQKVGESNMPYSEFARRINYSRSSLYNLFAKKSIDVELLLRISEVLDYDFMYEVYHIGDKRREGRLIDEQSIENVGEDIVALLKSRLLKE